MSQIQTEQQPNGETDESRMDVDNALTGQSLSLAGQQHSGTDGTRAISLAAQRQKLIEPKIGYVYDEEMLLHACLAPDGHPEQPDRITRIYNTLLSSSVISHMKRIPARPVEREEALLVHSQILWDKVMAIAGRQQFSSRPINHL